MKPEIKLLLKKNLKVVTLKYYKDLMKSIGEGNGNPLQGFCLENPRDTGAWWAAVYGVAQSRTWLKQLSSNETYADFLARLKTAISHSVTGKKKTNPIYN